MGRIWRPWLEPVKLYLLADYLLYLLLLPDGNLCLPDFPPAIQNSQIHCAGCLPTRCLPTGCLRAGCFAGIKNRYLKPDRAVVVKRRNPHVFYIGLFHAFHPDGFPYPALRCVEKRGVFSFFLQFLLASGMRGLLRPVRHGKSKLILPLPQAIRDVKVKRKVSPLMTSHPDSIDKYTALLINGAEMKKNPAFLKTFRKSEFLSVMKALVRHHDFTHAREHGFRGKRDDYRFIVEVCRFGFIDTAFPLSVQVKVTVSH